MKRTTLLACTIAVLLTITSCNKGLILQGTLTNGGNKTIYIEELIPHDEPLLIDSLQLGPDGSFRLKHAVPYTTFYNVHVSPQDYVVLLVSPGDRITINGDYDHLSTSYTVEGSDGTRLLWDLQDFSNIGVEELKEIVALNEHNKSTLSADSYEKAKQETDSLYRESFFKQRDYVLRFINNNRGSLTTLIALYKPFNVNHPLIRPERDFEVYESVLDGLEHNPKLKSNPHVMHFRTTVEQYRYLYGISDYNPAEENEETK
ncbi:MAG: DUF4369 domain-containing protein [Bacteroidales bacterium]|nr:DUF4369 domain-containing protein [Bacteroidales bacterium]